MCLVKMKELLENAGLCHLVRHLSSFLDVKSLAQCRLVSQAWRDLIENDRPWWIFQLEHIQTKEKMFVEGKKPFKSTIMARFPKWTGFTKEFSRNQRIVRLKKLVEEMWIYFNDDKVQCECPLLYAVEIDVVRLLLEQPEDKEIDLRVVDQEGFTPLNYAWMEAQLPVIMVLLFNYIKLYLTSLPFE